MGRTQSNSTDSEALLQQLRDGDAQAFDRLFARHRPYLRRVIEIRLDDRLRSRVDPSDVVQETQLDAFRNLADYLARVPMPFRLWLRKTAHQRLAKLRERHLEAARRAVVRELPLPDRSTLQLARLAGARAPSPSQRLARAELSRRVRQAVARLAPNDREIILMRTFEGLSNPDIAQILDLDPGTVSKRHGRALLRLHRILVETGITESDL